MQLSQLNTYLDRYPEVKEHLVGYFKEQVNFKITDLIHGSYSNEELHRALGGIRELSLFLEGLNTDE